jgi:Uma2 family endonuclease
MSQATRLVTADELEHLPEYERFELVKGRLVPMSPVSPLHALIVPRVIMILGRFLDDHPVGVILADCGFKLESDPDTVRGPDIAFIRQDRFASLYREGFVHGTPDLVIEVLSPADRSGEMREKLDDYFRVGVPIVVVVDPRKRSATVHRGSAEPVVLHGDDAVLEIADLLPGFRCTLGEIFT